MFDKHELAKFIGAKGATVDRSRRLAPRAALAQIRVLGRGRGTVLHSSRPSLSSRAALSPRAHGLNYSFGRPGAFCLDFFLSARRGVAFFLSPHARPLLSYPPRCKGAALAARFRPVSPPSPCGVQDRRGTDRNLLALRQRNSEPRIAPARERENNGLSSRRDLRATRKCPLGCICIYGSVSRLFACVAPAVLALYSLHALLRRNSGAMPQ